MVKCHGRSRPGITASGFGKLSAPIGQLSPGCVARFVSLIFGALSAVFCAIFCVVVGVADQAQTLCAGDILFVVGTRSLIRTCALSGSEGCSVL